jgi:hypothetical protein
MHVVPRSDSSHNLGIIQWVSKKRHTPTDISRGQIVGFTEGEPKKRRSEMRMPVRAWGGRKFSIGHTIADFSSVKNQNSLIFLTKAPQLPYSHVLVFLRSGEGFHVLIIPS